ncbi:Histone H2A deubiquitinase MYSM1 [Smittium culicis]|uniref:Histone H2A deubiquitinase MYSM1 n=1 Tax=Smittium culicis TaxID=133412 RepID=A0A1R1XTA3_9FUNG|nr:Histone H2A deubiquitinase MYSM1 [Smittium culicis]
MGNSIDNAKRKKDGETSENDQVDIMDIHDKNSKDQKTTRSSTRKSKRNISKKLKSSTEPKIDILNYSSFDKNINSSNIEKTPSSNSSIDVDIISSTSQTIAPEKQTDHKSNISNSKRSTTRTPAKKAVQSKKNDSTNSAKKKSSSVSSSRSKKTTKKAPVSPKQESKVLSKAEEEELSSALIAQLLAADNDSIDTNYFKQADSDYEDNYYDEYFADGKSKSTRDYESEYDDDNDSEHFDDEYDPIKAYNKNSSSKKHSKGYSASKITNENSSNSLITSINTGDINTDGLSNDYDLKASKLSESNSISASAFNVGVYSDQEEALFLEGLNTYGRDYQKISELMKTRESKSIRSHAQKHFIKLFRDNLPLPPKVAESGTGYTLSGKPLDPNSAAAKPYLSHLTEIDTSNVQDQDALKIDNSETKDSNFNSKNSNNFSSIDSPANELQEKKPLKQKNSVKKEKAVSKKEDAVIVSNTTISGPTEYSLMRPKRNKVSTKYNSSGIEKDSDPHALVKCSTFSGEPGTGSLNSQPFKLFVHTNAQLLMDLHSHLMETEIIGLLGGSWDSINRVLTVKQSFPCKALVTDDDHLNVEMDPTSEFLVRQEIADMDMRVVGWYHSHPSFLPDPSNIDIQNQNAYQKLFMDNGLFELDELNSQNDEKKLPESSSNVSNDPVVNIDTYSPGTLNSGKSIVNEINIEKMDSGFKSDVGYLDGADTEIDIDSIKDSNCLIKSARLVSKDSENDNSTNTTAKSKVSVDTEADETEKGAPFIGAIVGPYDPKLPKSFSVINWFMVICESLNGANKLVPKKLNFVTLNDDFIPESLISKSQELIDSYSNSTHRMKFMRAWRSGSSELRLTKCLLSLAFRIPWIDHVILTDASYSCENPDSAQKKVSSSNENPNYYMSSDSEIESIMNDTDPDLKEHKLIVDVKLNSINDGDKSASFETDSKDKLANSSSPRKDKILIEENLNDVCIKTDEFKPEVTNELLNLKSEKINNSETLKNFIQCSSNKNFGLAENDENISVNSSSGLSSVDIEGLNPNAENNKSDFVVSEPTEASTNLSAKVENEVTVDKDNDKTKLPTWITSVPFLNQVHDSLIKWK